MADVNDGADHTVARTEGPVGATSPHVGEPFHAGSIPDIQLGGLLGEGGMARVYDALDLGFSPPRRVAVKLMSPALSADPEFRMRFEREASIVADFRHDNVVHVYRSGEADGEKYLVMEYLGGGTLAKRLEAGPLPLAEAISVARQLAGALAYSHSKIVHRDFKPGNVLFTAENKPVLTDFGVARKTSSLEPVMTRHAAVIGAPRYMAPEQERGEPATDRADVYSWGLTLFEMLTGRHPRPGYRVIYDPAGSVTLLRDLAGTPPNVARLIARCLAADPAARPSAEECADELGATTIPRIPELDSDGDPHESSPKANRRWWLVVIGSGVLAALALVGFVRQGGNGQLHDAAGLETGEPSPDRMRQPGMAVTILRAPPTARVFIAGLEIPGTTVSLLSGLHEAVAVAAGHYGRHWNLGVGNVSPDPIEVRLLPVVLPSRQEHDRFLDLADASVVSLAELDDLREATLHAVILMRYLRQQGDMTTLAALESELATLAAFGDERSAVVRYLNESIDRGRFDLTRAQAMLTNASRSGDAMASFFLAVAMREALHGSGEPAVATNPEFRAYCRQLRLAIEQGWIDVPTDVLVRDSCER